MERRSARNPRRASHPTSARTATASANAAAAVAGDRSCARVSVATAEPTSSAEALSGPTDRTRLLPEERVHDQGRQRRPEPGDRFEAGEPRVGEALGHQIGRNRDAGYGITASGPSPTAYCRQARHLRGWREEPAEVGHGTMMGHIGTVVVAVGVGTGPPPEASVQPENESCSMRSWPPDPVIGPER